MQEEVKVLNNVSGADVLVITNAKKLKITELERDKNNLEKKLKRLQSRNKAQQKYRAKQNNNPGFPFARPPDDPGSSSGGSSGGSSGSSSGSSESTSEGSNRSSSERNNQDKNEDEGPKDQGEGSKDEGDKDDTNEGSNSAKLVCFLFIVMVFS